MKKHIHIFGASGSGCTTIAREVSKRLGYSHFDSDNYFWLQTEEPFTIERDREECLNLMNEELSNSDNWILSGSIADWGNVLIPHFDLAVFVYVAADERLERLKKREYERYGDEMLVGGTKHEKAKKFLDWAAGYDEGKQNGRSLPKHESWLKNLKCESIKIINNNFGESVGAIINAINK